MQTEFVVTKIYIYIHTHTHIFKGDYISSYIYRKTNVVTLK